MTEIHGVRDGSTFDPTQDQVRLNVQATRVWNVMYPGFWHTLKQISGITGDPEASVSARLRDFRKVRFGGHTVNRRRMTGGLYAYQLVAA